ncbi:MAG TPA: tetratricopeptide repeat protein, partial [Bacteroidia bacterium]|nr:tetratricopeptide repeat protein [Bacteroidia bacterium]
LKTERNDTSKISTLYLLSDKLTAISKYDSALTCANEAINLANSLPPSLGRDKGIAAAYRILGIINYSQSNYPKALDYDLKALTADKGVGDKKSTANDLGNIGSIYYIIGNSAKALDFGKQAMDLDREIGNQNGVAANLGNMGNILMEQAAVISDKKASDSMYRSALTYEFEALKIEDQLKNNNVVAYILSCIGTIYLYQANYPEALEYNYKALGIDREIGNNVGLTQDLLVIGESYLKANNKKQARLYIDSSINFSKNIGEKDILKNAYKSLSELDSAESDYKAGWDDYRKYISYRDSLVNEANTKKTVQAEMNYEFDQKQLVEKAQRDKEQAIAEQERKRRDILLYSFMVGFALMLTLAFIIYQGYKQKRRDNLIIKDEKREVERQKILVEEKNKEVLDSIMYAKYLQDAILPTLSSIKQCLPESFVLYKPKDIVAGDFYWLERTESEILIAAADCTGHGVPGALVSVVCSNALNSAVKEFKITEPGKILDKVRELVVETFEKSENNVQDGMDISLASLIPGKGGMQVQWSGAFNPLWYLQNGELKEVIADKQPVGKFESQSRFTTHTLYLKKGDCMYLFTDGYADQFGGPKGKKFKYKQLSDMLKVIGDKPMEVQRQILEDSLKEWKGELTQMDDIL